MRAARQVWGKLRGGGWNVLRFFINALIWRGIIFQTRLFSPLFWMGEPIFGKNDYEAARQLSAPSAKIRK
jgi:hypothetical protein